MQFRLVKMHIQCQEGDLQPVAYQPAQMEKTLILKLKELNSGTKKELISVLITAEMKKVVHFSLEKMGSTSEWRMVLSQLLIAWKIKEEE